MKFLKAAVIALLVFLLLTSIFLILLFRWASSGRVPRERLSEIQHIEAGGFPISRNRKVFKIMSYNIGYCAGISNNQPERRPRIFFESNLRGIVQLIKKVRPDVVCFQEVDFNAHRSYGINQMQEIAGQSGIPHAALAINWDKRYVPFPYWPPSVHFKDIISGQCVISSHPIDSAYRHVLPKVEEKPFYYRAFYLDRLAQVTKIRLMNRTLVVINVHLEAFEKRTRFRQAKMVLDIYRRYKDRYPVILAGDFNCVPPSASRKSGFVDEPGMDFHDFNVIELFMRQPDLKEAFLSGAPKRSEANSFTFPANAPTRKLDYIFYNPRDIRCLAAEVLQLDSSDHFPLLMEFSFGDPAD